MILLGRKNEISNKNKHVQYSKVIKLWNLLQNIQKNRDLKYRDENPRIIFSLQFIFELSLKDRQTNNFNTNSK